MAGVGIAIADAALGRVNGSSIGMGTSGAEGTGGRAGTDVTEVGGNGLITVATGSIGRAGGMHSASMGDSSMAGASAGSLGVGAGLAVSGDGANGADKAGSGTRGMGTQAEARAGAAVAQQATSAGHGQWEGVDRGRWQHGDCRDGWQ